MSEHRHPRDEELLLAAAGELSSRRLARTRSHLRGCPQCRGRIERMENSLEEFTSVYKSTAKSPPPERGWASSLKSRLAESRSSGGFSGMEAHFAIAALAILVIALGAMIRVDLLRDSRERFGGDYETQAIPRMVLTPGATRAVTREEVCSEATAAMAPGVPETLKMRVFAEYGMSPATADEYEVDYLVTPELGGAQDIRNLWPQPYSATIWNAHVKDDLEGRLHSMVCSGQMDLATAQRELSSDWISAYKKYFHSEKPL